MDPRQEQRLTREKVLAAAVALIDDHGLEALTMRRLAQQLGIGTMSLYSYVPSKDALLDGVVGAVLGDMDLSAVDLDDWSGAAREILRSFRRTAKGHPAIVPLLTTRPPITPEALRPVEMGLEALRRAGFDEETSAHVYRLLAGYVIGYVSLELGGFFGRYTTMTELPGFDFEMLSQLPRIVEIAPYLLDWDPDAEFEIGIDLILSGVKTRIERTSE